jgi:hypothetical protein
MEYGWLTQASFYEPGSGDRCSIFEQAISQCVRLSICSDVGGDDEGGNADGKAPGRNMPADISPPPTFQLAAQDHGSSPEDIIQARISKAFLFSVYG